jgi:uncharacterized membrane protein YfcA
MPDAISTLILAVFALAGFVKGVVGLGLPTIAMGLLALMMPPVEAAAVLILPSLVTNIWQMLGHRLSWLIRRLWPMQLGICAGTWVGSGLMSGQHSEYATAALGAALALYAISGLVSFRVSITAKHEPWLGPIAGAITGLVTAATGVFVIPAVPYLQSINLEKEDLVQALGLSFTVSTMALAYNLASAGALTLSLAATTFGALAAAGTGMLIGQTLRQRLAPAAFRQVFFAGLLLLGLYLLLRATQ